MLEWEVIMTVGLIDHHAKAFEDIRHKYGEKPAE